MTGEIETGSGAAWGDLPTRLRARGLRWTPQRRTLIEVLATTSGHVTGSELVERCRALDPTTVPSTVYRTLDVLEDLGVVRHAHGLDGREEFHVSPAVDHGHLHCTGCHSAWEIGPEEAHTLVAALERSRGFTVNLSHLSIAGVCDACRAAGATRRRPAPSLAFSGRPRARRRRGLARPPGPTARTDDP